MSIKHWLKGLVAAFVSGATNSASMMFVDPEHFNIHQLRNVGEVALVGGIVGLVMYLKQSPVPPDEAK